MGERVATFRRVLGNRDLRRIQLALVGSEIGYWGFTVAFGVWAFAEGGAAFVAVAAVVRMVPGAVAGPLAGALADRHARRRVMVVSNLFRSLTLAAAAAGIVAGLPALVLVAVGLNSMASTAFRPALSALLPDLTHDPSELTAANVVAGAIDSSALFVGPALGGLLLLVVGPESVLLAAAGATAVSALLVSRVGGEKPRPEPAAGEDPGLLRAVREGIGVVRAQPGLRVVLVAVTGQTFVWGALTVLMVVVALDMLGRGDAWVGYLSAAIGIGCLAGTALATGLVGHGRLGTAVALALAASSAPLVILGAAPGAVVALATFVVVGMAMTVVDVAAMTLLQRIAPEAVLARVFGLLETIIYGAIALGAAAAPLAIGLAGHQTALIVLGALLPVLALVSWGALTSLDRLAPAGEPRVLVLLRASPIFAPLPAPTLERLAAAAMPVRVPSGRRVFAQGDVGDLYYLIDEGTADVVIDGRTVRTLGPGDGFGEIALLNDAPRTADVAAADDLSLLSLAREDFLTAVTGHPSSAQAAAGVVAARLRAAAPASAIR